MAEPIRDLIAAARDHVLRLHQIHASARPTIHIARQMLLQALIEPLEIAIAAAEARPAPAAELSEIDHKIASAKDRLAQGDHITGLSRIADAIGLLAREVRRG